MIGALNLLAFALISAPAQDLPAEYGVFTAFHVDAGELVTDPIVIVIGSEKSAKKTMLVGVGWYEYIAAVAGKATLISEDRGKITDRRLLTTTEEFGPLYRIFNNKEVGTPCEPPDWKIKSFQKANEIQSDFEKHDYQTVWSGVEKLTYRQFETKTVGLRAWDKTPTKRIVFGRDPTGVRVIVIHDENGLSLSFLRVPNTEAVTKLVRQHEALPAELRE